MDIKLINYIKSNPLMYSYLRENSSWYKYLNRGQYIKEFEEEAKKYYKVTPEEKIKKLSRNIDLIASFIDVLK